MLLINYDYVGNVVTCNIVFHFKISRHDFTSTLRGYFPLASIAYLIRNISMHIFGSEFMIFFFNCNKLVKNFGIIFCVRHVIQ